MEISLPKEALDALPAPDSKGLVRVSATLELRPGGKVALLEINDSPVGEPESDDANPMPSPPSMDDAPESLY